MSGAQAGSKKAELSNLVGRTLGSYRILKLLGAGGMGAVFLGEHQAIGHKAAIKVLHPSVARDEETAQRFFNEARAVNLVKHSGIVQIFDYGQEPGVGAYLVMEFLEGQSLGERLRESGPFEPSEAVRIVCRVASALGAAHKGGLIHRDLKPDNVFLLHEEEDGGGQRVKVVDFGIAKLGDHKTSGVKTATGLIVGTPLYMAPEYIHGNKAFDHRIDVYSLGIIAYEMLCGRPPFLGDGLGEMLLAHMVTPPPPLSQFRGNVPPALEAAIMRALAKDPAERYAGMDELAQALLAAIGASPPAKTSTRGSITTGATGAARASGPVRATGATSLRVAPADASPETALATTIAPTPAPAEMVSATSAARNADVAARNGPPSTITASAAEIRADAALASLPERRGRSTKTVVAAVAVAVAVAAATAVVLAVAGVGGDDAETGDVGAGSDRGTGSGRHAVKDDGARGATRSDEGDSSAKADLAGGPATAAEAAAPAASSATAATGSPAAPAATVRHRIESSVEGARVVCLDDGSEGRAPWSHEHALAKGKAKYEVSAAGYETKLVSLAAKTDGVAVAKLVPVKGAGVGSGKRPGSSAPGTATAHAGKTSATPRTAAAAPGPKTERPLAED
ncbi:MAG TPA: protein kinase [Myxococcota bacterium]|nr:protein kinase [Myxococcota bacterium]